MALHLALESLPLRKTVEGDVVCCIKNLVDFVVIVDGGEYVDFLAHFLLGQKRFVEAACCCSGEVFANQREGAPEAVAFESADDFDAGSVLDIREDFHVAAETGFVQDETGARNLCIIEHT